MKSRDTIIDWLRDAHAMECGLEVALRKLAENPRQQPDIRSAAATHMSQSARHGRTIEGLLRSLGSDISVPMTGLGIVTETIRSFGTSLMSDEPLKDLVASYSAEQLEIASYHALIAGAEEAGLKEVSEACKGILAEEQWMAERILAGLPATAKVALTQPRFKPL
jgi:ferritin-like metal-binding protein YciE